MARNSWPEVSKERLCPICGEGRRCKFTDDGNAARCFRQGDRRLQVANGKQNRNGLVAMWAKAKDPARCAKIAAARRGKPRPPEVIEAMRQANLGRKLPAEQRAKMSAAHKRRRTMPPAAGKAFSARELRLIRSLPPADAAKRTGRTLTAVYSQRSRLGSKPKSDSSAGSTERPAVAR